MNSFLVLCIALTLCYATAQYGAPSYRTISRLDQQGTTDFGSANSQPLQDLQGAGSAYNSYGQSQQAIQPLSDNIQQKPVVSAYGQPLTRPSISLTQQDIPQFQKPNYGAEFSSEQQQQLQQQQQQLVRPQVIQPVLDQQSPYSTNVAQKQLVQDVQQPTSAIVRPQQSSQIVVFPFQTRQQSVNPYGAALQQRMQLQQQQQQAQLQRPGFGYGFGQQVRPVVGYAYATQQQLDVPQVPQTLPPTQEDIMCQGKQPGTIIPLPDLRSAVTCVDDGKGFELKCPKHLYWNTQVNRCERKISQLLPPCLSNPCQNGGVCSELDIFTYKCDCPAGFEGPQCERDQRACAQNPCGPDGVCKGFRFGSALPYVCLCQEGNAYGPSCQQAIQNPCQGDEQHLPLGYTDKGFIMCDGEQFFVESCPGTTVWDNTQKTCAMAIVAPVPTQDQSQFRNFQQQDSYSSYQAPKSFNTYNQQPQQQQAQPINNGYGSQQFDEQKRRHHHHRQQLDIIPQQPMPTIPQQGAYGSAIQQQQDIQPQKFIASSMYNSKPIQQDVQPIVNTYGSSNTQSFDQQRPTFAFGQRQLDTIPRPTFAFGQRQSDSVPQPISAYGQRQLDIVQPQQQPTNNYS